jgi:hypothetical protein
MIPWLTKLGQCLVCGGRGGYPGPGCTILCGRCEGTGRDLVRSSDWYMDFVLPQQATQP